MSDERRRMPLERRSVTHKAIIHDQRQGGTFKFYVTAGMYEDGTLGEVFCKDAGREGSTIQGLLDAWATSLSINLQWGESLDSLAQKFANMRFEPFGTTEEPGLPYVFSMVDYAVRWLVLRFGSPELAAKLQQETDELLEVLNA